MCKGKTKPDFDRLAIWTFILALYALVHYSMGRYKALNMLSCNAKTFGPSIEIGKHRKAKHRIFSIEVTNAA
jgi:hypothetical protein